MNLIYATLSLAAWAVTARYLFRRWVKNDTFTEYNPTCSHDYQTLHRGTSCHGRRPVTHIQVALFAAVAALAFPVVLFLLFVMANPPVSRTALENSIRELENENKKLRKETE